MLLKSDRCFFTNDTEIISRDLKDRYLGQIFDLFFIIRCTNKKVKDLMIYLALYP